MSQHQIQMFRYVPDLRDEALVLEAFRGGGLTGGGNLRLLQDKVASVCGVSRSVCVASVSSAVSMLAAGLELGPDDDVVMSPLAPAAIAAGLRARGVNIIFADISPATLNLDADRVDQAITPATRAVVFSHTFGNPTGIEQMARVAGRHEVILLEDTTESLGATVGGRSVGSFGRAAIASLGPNSAIPSGPGGLVITDDERLGDTVAAIREGRVSPTGSVMPMEAGWPAELSVALSLAQLQRFEELKTSRLDLASAYVRTLMGVHALVTPSVEERVTAHWCGMVCRLEAGYTADERDRIVQQMRSHDIEAAVPRRCVHNFSLSASSRCTGMVAASIAARLIRLPFHLAMTRRDLDLVAQTLTHMISRENLKRN